MLLKENSWAKKVLVGAVGSAAGLWAADKLLQSLYGPDEVAGTLHNTTTKDGVEIGLWHHPPADGGDGEPVLIAHGLGVNHFHMDLDEQFSVARYLSEQGYDCWCIELRGRGASEVPEEPWSFDDYVQKDVPAAVDYVLDQTGYSKLHWVGHSMGGMMYYASAGAVQYQDKFASAVSLGGPFHGKRNRDGNGEGLSRFFRGPDWSGDNKIFVPILNFFRSMRIPWTVAARWGAMASRQLRKVLPRTFVQLFFNPDNISDSVIRKAGVRAVDKVEARVLSQFAEWGLNRHWTDENREMDYREAITDIRVPTLLVAGRADKMCPVHNQRSGFEQLGCDRKELVVAGRDNGFTEDYSHVDLIYGKNAREEIFPLITDWLRNHPVDERESSAATDPV